jgi:hypothetical protein
MNKLRLFGVGLVGIKKIVKLGEAAGVDAHALSFV